MAIDSSHPHISKSMTTFTEIPGSGNERTRFEVVYPGDWNRVAPVFGATDASVIRELGRLFRTNVLPGKKNIGRVVLVSIPEDLPDPFPRVTGEGTLLDPEIRFNYWFRRLHEEGDLSVAGPALEFRNTELRDFYNSIAARGLVASADGDGGLPRFLSVYNRMLLLSGKSRNSIVTNSHFFQMEMTDCGAVWDRLGNPFGLLVHRGEVLLPPLFGREALLVDRSGEAIIGYPSLADLAVRIGSDVFQEGKNAEFFARPEFERTPAEQGCIDIVIVGQRIIGIKTGGNTVTPSGGFVLRAGTGFELTTQDVSYAGMDNFLFGVQAGPMMITRGKTATGFTSPFFRGVGTAFPPTVYPLDWHAGRAARLGLGSKDGRPVVVWAEGASRLFYTPGMDSAGASLSEFADFCGSIGVENLVNLDGGGSAQICIDGGRHLRLSDRHGESGMDAERPVPVGLSFGSIR